MQSELMLELVYNNNKIKYFYYMSSLNNFVHNYAKTVNKITVKTKEQICNENNYGTYII